MASGKGGKRVMRWRNEIMEKKGASMQDKQRGKKKIVEERRDENIRAPKGGAEICKPRGITEDH